MYVTRLPQYTYDLSYALRAGVHRATCLFFLMSIHVKSFYKEKVDSVLFALLSQ